MIGQLTPTLAKLLCQVLNKVFEEGGWPKIWRHETQTVIPKSSNPASFDELRNLSCTNLFSKLMEVFVLEQMSSEVNNKPNQYGGVKGSSTNHFLINTYQNIMNAMEDNKKSVSIISVDFSKAFNWMHHGQCLKALAHGGASQNVLVMVDAFLRDRTTYVRQSRKCKIQTKDSQRCIAPRHEDGNFFVYSNNRCNRRSQPNKK